MYLDMRMNFNLKNSLNIFTVRNGETVETGTLIGSEHPCYEEIRKIIDDYKKKEQNKEDMRVKDLIKECKSRPTQKDCYYCSHKSECNWLKRWLSDICPSELENIQEYKIPIN